jgi:hypothetical protein
MTSREPEGQLFFRVPMYQLEMTLTIMFARERMSAVTLRTDEWLYPVRVVRLHVRLHVMVSRKC